MFKCNIRGVDLDWCNSRDNFIVAESWNEVYFGVVQIETSNGTILAEKIETSNGTDDWVYIDITLNGFRHEHIPFRVILKSDGDGDLPPVGINENSLISPKPLPPIKEQPVDEFILETVKQIEDVPPTVDTSSVLYLKQLKEDAINEVKKHAESIKHDVDQLSRVEEIIENKFDLYKQDILKEFYESVDRAISTFKATSSKHILELSETLVNDVVSTCEVQINEQLQKAKDQVNEASKDVTKQRFSEYKQNVDSLIQESADVVEGKLELSIADKINEAHSKLEVTAQQTREQVLSLIEQAKKTIFNVEKEKLEKASDDIVERFHQIEQLIKEVEEQNTIIDEKINKIENPSEEDLIKDADRYLNALALENKTTIDAQLAQFEETAKSKLEAISLDGLYAKFNEQHGPKVEKAVAEILEAKTVPQKFKFFKDKAVKQEFEQLVYSALLKKEADWIRQVKKIVMDFYYSWGSGGGSGNVTINQGTSGGGGPTTDPYKVFSTSGLTGVSSVIDTFPIATFKTAKYTIEVLSGAEMYSSEISVLGNASVARLTEYAVLCTTDPVFLTYQAVTDGTNVLLIAIAQTNLLNMSFQGIRIDPILS